LKSLGTAAPPAKDSDGYSGTQTQDYSKGKDEMENKSKVLGTGTIPMIKAGGSGSTKSPTGSSQSYAKGSKVNMSADWNPQKLPASTYGIKGV
jgi:hypothetical protein